MSNFSAIINEEQPVLVDFYADWCGPCKTMAPVIQQIAGAFNGKLRVLKVNVDKNAAASNQYGIQSIPTLILFKKGQIVWRQAGAVPAHVLKSAIEKHLI